MTRSLKKELGIDVITEPWVIEELAQTVPRPSADEMKPWKEAFAGNLFDEAFDGPIWEQASQRRGYYSPERSRTDDPGSILDLPTDFTAAQLKEAFRRAVKIHHPDCGGTEEGFRAVTDAYERLMTGAASPSVCPHP